MSLGVAVTCGTADRGMPTAPVSALAAWWLSVSGRRAECPDHKAVHATTS
jgi:hypothetical protein